MVEINLLPPKKPKINTPRLTVGILAFVWGVGTIVTGYAHYCVVQEQKALSQQIEQQEKILSRAEQKQSEDLSPATWKQYADLSEKMKQLFYPPTVMLDELAQSLPANSRLTEVKYTLNGQITVQGYFEKYEDIAAYVHHLEKSPHMVSATMKSITALPVTWNGKEEPSPLAKAAGGKVQPRYRAEFTLVAVTIDEKNVVRKKG